MLHFQNQISAAGRPPTTKKHVLFFFGIECSPRGPTCLALAKKDSSVILCRTCEQRKNGKTVREKCHRKHQQAPCDCNICTQHEHANLDGTTKHDQEAPKRKRHRSKLDYSQKAQKITSTVFLLTRESCMLMFVRMGEKQKANTPQTQTQQQQTQRSGQQQDATQVKFASKETCILNSVKIASCGFVLCVVML